MVCLCGCGGAPNTGKRYVHGHNATPPEPWYDIDPISNCWNWNRYVGVNGYGRVDTGQRRYQAHRFMYTRLIGMITPGFTLDHLCRNKKCVNPYHMEPVTSRVNTLRGTATSAVNARKTECIKGHKFKGKNLVITELQRVCRTCRNGSALKRYHEGKIKNAA